MDNFSNHYIGSADFATDLIRMSYQLKPPQRNMVILTALDLIADTDSTPVPISPYVLLNDGNEVDIVTGDPVA